MLFWLILYWNTAPHYDIWMNHSSNQEANLHKWSWALIKGSSFRNDLARFSIKKWSLFGEILSSEAEGVFARRYHACLGQWHSFAIANDIVCVSRKQAPSSQLQGLPLHVRVLVQCFLLRPESRQYLYFWEGSSGRGTFHVSEIIMSLKMFHGAIVLLSFVFDFLHALSATSVQEVESCLDHFLEHFSINISLFRQLSPVKLNHPWSLKKNMISFFSRDVSVESWKSKITYKQCNKSLILFANWDVGAQEQDHITTHTM